MSLVFYRTIFAFPANVPGHAVTPADLTEEYQPSQPTSHAQPVPYPAFRPVLHPRSDLAEFCDQPIHHLARVIDDPVLLFPCRGHNHHHRHR